MHNESHTHPNNDVPRSLYSPRSYSNICVFQGYIVTFYDCQCNSCSGVLSSFRHEAKTIQLARKVRLTLGLPNCFSFFCGC